ncbi:MAG: hypothetical protein ACOC44_06710 [Promethearchaeia archaeon]
MRIRTREKLKRKNAAIVVLFLLPLIAFLSYVGGLFIIINDMASYTYDVKPDPNDFYTESEINETLLAEIAEVLEYRHNKYHIPEGIINLTVSVDFTDYNYDTVDKWHETDNAALWGGEMLGAECHRYAVAKKEDNQVELDEAIHVIRRLVHGFTMLLKVPNGGLGPDYPGIPARFYAAPGQEDLFPQIFSDHYKMFNGSGDYKNWKCRLKTSKDELAGYILGLGSVLKFIDPNDSPDAKWCYEKVKLMVAQLIEGFKDTNWLVLHGDGYPAGSDNNMYFGGGAWKLAWLKLGELAYPEKYADDYNYVAAKELHLHQSGEGTLWNTIMEYYAYNFGQCVAYTLVLLEDDPELRHFYITMHENGFYDILKYHRNAWFNAAHLAFMKRIGEEKSKKFENPEYDHATIARDVKDQLYRFKAWVNPIGMSLSKNQWGVRNYNLTQRPHSTRATSENEDIRAMKVDPTSKEWRDFFENHIFGKLYAWVQEDLFDFEDYYLDAITVSEHGTASIIWARNPFYADGGDPYGNGLREERGLSFLLPYWIMRYYGYLDGA